MILIYMLLAMCAEINFPSTANHDDLLIRKPISVKVEKSWKRLTDTAMITLPKAVSDFDNNRIKELFRRGDPCEIMLGYDNQLQTEFNGYITRVSADYPVNIELEDSMYLLKIHSVSVSLKAAKLNDLLGVILPKGIEYQAAHLSLGNVRFANTTAAKVLQELRKQYGIYSYFKGDILICGQIYEDDEDVDPVVLHLEKNVKQSTRLKWQRAEDVKIKIRAVSTLKNGKKITVEVGDNDGEIRQLSYYNIESKSELDKLANIDLIKYKVDKLAGQINAFGRPFVEHGQRAQIVSAMYPERDGIYYVESTRIKFDRNGFERSIKIGDKT